MVWSRRLGQVELLCRTPLHPQCRLDLPVATLDRLQVLVPDRGIDIGCTDRWVGWNLSSGRKYAVIDDHGRGALVGGARPGVEILRPGSRAWRWALLVELAVVRLVDLLTWPDGRCLPSRTIVTAGWAEMASTP